MTAKRGQKGALAMTQERRHSRLRGDDGAALIEGALVAGPFFLLVFGILEFGLIFKDHLSIESVSTTSARSASTLGSHGEADYQILQQINRRALGVPRSSIHTIVVWHATGPGDTVPAGCKAGNGSVGSTVGGRDFVGACNVYDYNDFAWDVEDFDCNVTTEPPPIGPADHFWCPEDRKDTVLDAPEGSDYIGIYVAADYDYITGMFGDSTTLSASTIIPIEPAGLVG